MYFEPPVLLITGGENREENAGGFTECPLNGGQ